MGAGRSASSSALCPGVLCVGEEGRKKEEEGKRKREKEKGKGEEKEIERKEKRERRGGGHDDDRGTGPARAPVGYPSAHCVALAGSDAHVE